MAIRDRRLGGLKLRRQHPIGPFVADFCCPERRLIVEIDGPVHELQREHDTERTVQLTVAGYRVVRFGNDEVLDSMPDVLRQIHGAAEVCPSVPAPDRGRSRGW